MTDRDKEDIIVFASNCAAFLCELSKNAACGASSSKMGISLLNASDQYEGLCNVFGGIDLTGEAMEAHKSIKKGRE